MRSPESDAMWIRRTALLSLIVASLASACATASETPPAGPAAVVAPQSKAEPPVSLPNKEGTLKFAVLGDFGSAIEAAVPARRADGQAAAEVSVRAGHSRRRQPLRVRAAAGLRAQVRDSLQAAARPQSEVLRLARQSRRPEPALLQALQHGGQALLLLQGRPSRASSSSRSRAPIRSPSRSSGSRRS